MSKEDPFKIEKENFYMLFLGDYVDRGNYGIEVLYTILRLKIANPDKVFMVRGNHEERGMNIGYGFYAELENKYPGNEILYNKIFGIYNLLPVVFYCISGTQNEKAVMQCCHGGIELGYLPEKLFLLDSSLGFEWITILDRDNNLKHLCSKRFTSKKGYELTKQMIEKYVPDQVERLKDFTLDNLGFLWNDFIPMPKTYIEKSSRGSKLAEYGQQITKTVCAGTSFGPYQLKGFIRAHQHTNKLESSNGNPTMMKLILDKAHPESMGVAKIWRNEKAVSKTDLWDGIVCTFNVSPDTAYGQPFGAYPGFNFDTYAILTTGKDYPQDWSLAVKRIEVIS